MTAEERRQHIVKTLTQSGKAISAATLASSFNVSRQIIVGDIALLRAAGIDILATPRGYKLPASEKKISGRIACLHDNTSMRDELYTIVDEGCTVLDVIVEHPIYGELTGLLQLSSRHDVDEFMQRSGEENAQPLCLLTEGVHLHTIEGPDQASLNRVRESLLKKGYLLK